MNVKNWTAITLMAVLSACGKPSGNHEKQDVPPAPQGHVRIIPAIPENVTGEQRRAMSQQLIDMMAGNPSVSPDAYEGEAFRRGVTLTPEMRARKKASFDPRLDPASAAKAGAKQGAPATKTSQTAPKAS